MNLTVKDIPEPTMRRFRAWAALHGMNVSEAIVALMNEKGELVELREPDPPYGTKRCDE